MRFIGNKENILDNIYRYIIKHEPKRGVFCDFFAGTSNVGRYSKQRGYTIISSDLLFFSYVLQRAYIKNNKDPAFPKLIKRIKTNNGKMFATPLEIILSYLDKIPSKKGFIFKNYSEEGTKGEANQRKYFTKGNAMRIDAIRQQIEKWKTSKLINSNEYYILLACLIETVPFYANVSGVYAAYLKKYDPRALKVLKLRPIKIYKSHNLHKVYNLNSMKLLNNLNVDILYLDPPYNERQYAPNYHILETIAKYDNPQIKGVTGMRNWSDQKSEFCNKQTAISALDKIAMTSKYKLLVLSYNSEGIMPRRDIATTLSRHGEVKLYEFRYRRFKSNNNGTSKYKKHIKEQLYLMKPFLE